MKVPDNVPNTTQIAFIQQQIEVELKKARKVIKKEKPYIDIKPYSHNIISLILQHVSKTCGNKYANQLIDEFYLTHYGWSRVE